MRGRTRPAPTAPASTPRSEAAGKKAFGPFFGSDLKYERCLPTPIKPLPRESRLFYKGRSHITGELTFQSHTENP